MCMPQWARSQDHQWAFALPFGSVEGPAGGGVWEGVHSSGGMAGGWVRR